MEALVVYAGLFGLAFLAATLFPAQSEAALLALLMTERYSVYLLLLAVSLGNVLGSCLNYAIGRFMAENAHLRRFFGEKHRKRAEHWYRQYGKWSLLGSWLPIIGDPLTLVAGLLREPFAVFLSLVTVAKVGRYLAIIAVHQAWFG